MAHPLDVNFSATELSMALASCRSSSAPGPDGIRYATLAHLGEVALNHLTSIYNSSWESSFIPCDWKVARVLTILKPGKSPLDINSYRPIAPSSCLGKVMEKMIHTRLEWHLESRAIYSSCMSGFRRGRSSIDNVIDLI